MSNTKLNRFVKNTNSNKNVDKTPFNNDEFMNLKNNQKFNIEKEVKGYIKQSNVPLIKYDSLKTKNNDQNIPVVIYPINPVSNLHKNNNDEISNAYVFDSKYITKHALKRVILDVRKEIHNNLEYFAQDSWKDEVKELYRWSTESELEQIYDEIIKTHQEAVKEVRNFDKYFQEKGIINTRIDYKERNIDLKKEVRVLKRNKYSQTRSN